MTMKEMLQNLDEARALTATPKLDLHTPTVTREVHARAWGYDSAENAKRTFKALGVTATRNKPFSLRLDELFPIIERYRRNLEGQWHWKVPRTPAEILTMYTDAKTWEPKAKRRP
jgi:hypothetical protein